MVDNLYTTPNIQVRPMQTFTYKPKSVCSSRIKVMYDPDTQRLVKVTFEGGCSGNLTGISRLIEGMPITEVIERLKGVDCDGKGTSCPDQLVRALEQHFMIDETAK